MAREQRGQRGTWGRFLLGTSYGEPGPGLGTLYEAWRMEDGRPVLLLRPGGDVEWRPSGPWRVRLSCDPTREDSVTLDVDRSPPGASLSELANLLVLMSTSVERVEDDARVQAHLTGGPVAPPTPEDPRRDWRWSRAALTGMVLLALGLGVGLSTLSAHHPEEDGSSDLDSQTLAQTNAPYLPNAWATDAGTIAYPLPAKPFLDQAVAPCSRPDVELNGGCWLELAQRPPCEKDIFLEHQGKCYVPSPKLKRTRPPQAVEPSGP